MNITPRNMSIRSLFQSHFFKIPRFQRPYSWNAENIEDFWNDAIKGPTLNYFIGSMVFYGKANAQQLSVVDGQQRLTTITIFLAALRDTLVAAGEGALAQGIQNIIRRPDMSSELRYVLKTETSYPYFQEHIQKMGKPELDIVPGDEEKGLANAYNFASANLAKTVQWVQESTQSQKKKKEHVRKKLEAVRDALVSLDIIMVQLDSEDDAYVVFETLNTRGKDLEPKDLVKTHLTRLMPVQEGGVDVARVKWDRMLEDLDASAENLKATTYLHYQWLSTNNYTPERTLYKKIKEKIGKNEASGYLNQLLTDVRPYRRIFEPDNFDWAQEEQAIRRALVALSIFKVRQPTPLVLSLLRSYYNKLIRLPQLRDTLLAIERFHFLNTAVAGLSSSGGVSMMYAAAARDLSSAGDRQKRAARLQEFRAKLQERAPERERFNAGFAELHYGQDDTKAKPLVGYILERVDRAIRGMDPPVDYRNMTIEHISPQIHQRAQAGSRSAQRWGT